MTTTPAPLLKRLQKLRAKPPSLVNPEVVVALVESVHQQRQVTAMPSEVLDNMKLEWVDDRVTLRWPDAYPGYAFHIFQRTTGMERPDAFRYPPHYQLIHRGSCGCELRDIDNVLENGASWIAVMLGLKVVDESIQ
jgi:hypothetical protein